LNGIKMVKDVTFNLANQTPDVFGTFSSFVESLPNILSIFLPNFLSLHIAC